jgi:hypothetical protein
MLTDTETKIADMMRVTPAELEQTKAQRNTASNSTGAALRTLTNAVLPGMRHAARRLSIAAMDDDYSDDLAGENGPAKCDELIERGRNHLDCMDDETDDMSKRERLTRASRCLMAALEKMEDPDSANPDNPDIERHSRVGLVFANGNGVRS